MAFEQSLASVSTLNLKDVIFCRWCKGNLSLSTKLVQFECLHHGCIACLTKNLQDLRPGTLFSCPECDLSCMIPPGGVEAFPEEPLLKKMKAIADIHANNHPICQSCELLHQTKSSSHVCVTCKTYLCEDDSVRHRVQPDHEIVNIQKLQSEPYLSQMLQSKFDLCQKHSSEKKYYCKDCKDQICMECVVLDHSTHKKIAVGEVATEYKKNLEACVKKLEKSEQMAKERIQTTLKDAADLQQKLQEKLKKNREWQQKMTPENTEFAEMAKKARIQRDNANLDTQVLLRKISKLQMAQQYIKIFLKYGADADIIKKYQSLMEFSDESLANVESRIKSNGNPAINFNQGLSAKSENPSSKTLQKQQETKKIGGLHDTKLSQDFGKVLAGPWENRLSSCTLEAKWEAEENKGVAIDGENVFIIGYGKIFWKYGMDGKKKCDIKCPDLQVSCSIDVFKQEIYVTDQGERKRNILVMDMDGQLTRKIELPQKEHIGSSDDIHLAIDQRSGDIMVISEKRNMAYKFPAGEEKFIEFKLEGHISPFFVCLTPDSDIIVSEYGSTVKHFNNNGKLLWQYDGKQSGEGMMKSSRGVCTDHTGQIFVADSEEHKIHVVSPDGQFLGHVDIGEEILSPKALAFKNGLLVVTTDYKNTVYVIKCNYK